MSEELGGEPIGQPVGHPVWLPVGEAARRLGITREAVRRRIKRGTLETRREVDGNRVRTLVCLPSREPAAQPLTQPAAEPVGELAGHQEANPLALLERHVADLQAEVAWLRAELQRRRWPGLWPALVRFWRGEG